MHYQGSPQVHTCVDIAPCPPLSHCPHHLTQEAVAVQRCSVLQRPPPLVQAEMCSSCALQGRLQHCSLMLSQPITAPQGAAEPLPAQLCVGFCGWGCPGSQDCCASCKGNSGCCCWGCSSPVPATAQLDQLCPTLLCWMPPAVLFEHSGMHPLDGGERHHLALRHPVQSNLFM